MLTEDKTFNKVLISSLNVTLLMLLSSKYFKKAPYGKFGGNNKSINLDPRLGWFLMELPATVSFLVNFYIGRNRKVQKDKKNPQQQEGRKTLGPNGIIQKLFFCLWCIHYGNRGWFFPLTIRVAQGTKQSFALFNAAIGAIFLSIHGYLNGRMFSELGTRYTDDWLKDPRFLIGILIYICGYGITIQSESIVRNLRPISGIVSSQDRYKIPYGGMFRYVTNPAYLGELMCWTGFATAAWSPTLLPVLFISLSNLVPRALEQQKWYLKKFPDYPKDRTALIPFLL